MCALFQLIKLISLPQRTEAFQKQMSLPPKAVFAQTELSVDRSTGYILAYSGTPLYTQRAGSIGNDWFEG